MEILQKLINFELAKFVIIFILYSTICFFAYNGFSCK